MNLPTVDGVVYCVLFMANSSPKTLVVAYTCANTVYIITLKSYWNLITFFK
jgi:hypothetical protein